MKAKAPLSLIEQTVMILIFALAGALCLRVFVWADGHSRDNAQRDQALLLAQNAAQVLKSEGGDYAAAAEVYGGAWDGRRWTVFYDAGWQQTSGENTYRLSAVPEPEEVEYLGRAAVEVTDRNGRQLARLSVAWQEVVGDE